MLRSSISKEPSDKKLYLIVYRKVKIENSRYFLKVIGWKKK